MKTFIATPEEFATGHAAMKAVDIFRNRNRKPRATRPPAPKPHGQMQVGTISPEDFGAGRPYWGKRNRGHRTEPMPGLKPMSETIDEARLPDFLLDLADAYGNTFPRPRGNVIEFKVIDENTTYEKANQKIRSLLTDHGLLPSALTITPGPEVKKPFNRQIVLLLGRDTLL